jgi:hypothetical protein
MEAAGPGVPVTSDGRLSVVLPGFSNFGPDEGAGFSVSTGGLLNYGQRGSGQSAQWHPLAVTTHVEMAADLTGMRLDSVLPAAAQTSSQGLAWTVAPGEIPYGFSVTGESLDAESSAQQRFFFAGVIMRSVHRLSWPRCRNARSIWLPPARGCSRLFAPDFAGSPGPRVRSARPRAGVAV